MSNKDEPAFPQIWHPDMGCDPMKTPPGLTKRECFAAFGMMSIIQDRSAVYSIKSIVNGAVQYADALLEELEKER